MVIKKLYLDPFMDLCNREIVSYGISKRPSAESIMKALNEAIEITSDCQYRRIFHYDQVYYSYEELKVAIEKYIKYYNEQRIKEKLGWMSPVEYRVSLLAA